MSEGGTAIPATPRHAPIASTLARDAVRLATVDGFLAALGGALWSSPLRVERVFLSLQTIHPAFRARTYLWKRQTGRVTVIEWPHGLRNRPGYFDSPDFQVHRSGTELRVRDIRTAAGHPCQLYGKLKAGGYTDYLMVPLKFSDGTINTLSIATRLRDGFATPDLDDFRELGDLLTVILERYAALETRNATLDTYLGRSAAREILKGHIRSGHGERIEAAILFADLDDFTSLAAGLDPVRTVRLLNGYFDCLAGPVEQHGGYVLKFIGDAVLAFFPILARAPEPRVLDVVRAIDERLGALNAARESDGQQPLTHVLCGNFGTVLYGNVGSSERLDFTIIGEAVNVAARALEFGKSHGVPYVFTGAFAERFGQRRLRPLGAHHLKGIGDTPLFTLADIAHTRRTSEAIRLSS